jgi:hypothetical protein
LQVVDNDPTELIKITPAPPDGPGLHALIIGVGNDPDLERPPDDGPREWPLADYDLPDQSLGHRERDMENETWD